MDSTFTSWISSQLPRLAELLGERELRARDHEFQRLGNAPLWQVERDLQLLTRRVPWTLIRRAYRDLLRNPEHFIEAMYEIRVSAMLAPIADKLELAPKIGSGKCDLKCEVRGKEIFIEVSTREDYFPFEKNKKNVPITPLPGRVTVEASFDPTTAGDDPLIRGIPASQELRERILREISQLPSGELTVLVVGAPGGRSEYIEWALWGDVVIQAKSGQEPQPVRVPNGLFDVQDDLGGTSRLSALIWMRLVPHFHDVRAHSRLFTNPLAARPLSSEIEEVFRNVFDKRQVLLGELERIKRTLLEKYDPERIILFGSLADDYGVRPGGAQRPDTVHEWSDIDLAIVKSTPLRFMDRIREVMDLVEPHVGLNVLVYTPEEFARAGREGHFFVREEILKKGRVLFPRRRNLNGGWNLPRKTL